MCGIFGVISSAPKQVTPHWVRGRTTELLKLSESRGKEAAGLAYGETLHVLKRPYPASQFMRSDEYRDFFHTGFGKNRQVSDGARFRRSSH